MSDLTTFLLVGRQSARFEDVRKISRRVQRWFDRRGTKEEILRPNQKKAKDVEEGEEEDIQDFSAEEHHGEEENSGDEARGEEEQIEADEEAQDGEEEQANGEEETGQEEHPDLDGDEETEPITSLEPKFKKVIPSKPNDKVPFVKRIECLIRDPSSPDGILIYGESPKGTGAAMNLNTRVLSPVSHPLGDTNISQVFFYKTKQVFVSFTAVYIYDTATNSLSEIRTTLCDPNYGDTACRYHNPTLIGSVLYMIVYNNNLWTVDLEDPKLIAKRFCRKEYSQVIWHKNTLVGVHHSGAIRSLDPLTGVTIKEAIICKKPNRSVVGIPLGNHLLLSWTHHDISKEESTEVKFMLVRPKDFKIIGTQTTQVELHREDREWDSDLLVEMFAFVRRGGSFVFHVHEFGRMGVLFRRGPKLHVVLETTQAVRGDRINGAVLIASKSVLLLSQYIVYSENFKPSVIQYKLNW